MKIYEVVMEQMPGNQEIAQMKKDSADLQKMSASGNVDNAVAINTMQRMAKTAAKADIGSQMLKFFQMFAASIKEGIDSGAYGNRVSEMQAAYDQIMAEMPKLKQMAADSRKMAVQHGGAGRQDVGETASGMGASSVATVVGNVGPTQSRNMYNADGTMKNGLEYGNLLGGKKKSKKNKQA